MSEGEQTAPQEVKQPSRVVEAARKAVRTGLETSEDFKKMRNELDVKKMEKTLEGSTYRSWMNATDRVIGAMTQTDRDKLSTKLYKIKNTIVAAGVHVAAGAIDTTIRVLTWPGRTVGKIAGLAMAPFTGGATAGIYVFMKGLDIVTSKGPVRTYETWKAAKHAEKKILKYKVAESALLAKGGAQVIGEKTKQIIEGFAYPEGKPPKPIAR